MASSPLAKVVPGQVVQAQDILFQIVDPQGLWVEALVYGEIDPTSLADATAVATGGQAMPLAFRGFSRALQQHASVVHFAVPDPPANLSIGQPVTVHGDERRADHGLDRSDATPWCAAATAKPSCGCTSSRSGSSRGRCAPSRSMRRA